MVWWVEPVARINLPRKNCFCNGAVRVSETPTLRRGVCSELRVQNHFFQVEYYLVPVISGFCIRIIPREF